MAYDRYDRDHRNDGGRNDDHDQERAYGARGERRGGPSERGWFERAGEEISSWFGSDEHRDHDRDYRRERGSMEQDRGGRDEDHRSDRGQNRGVFAGGGSSAQDYNPSWQSELSSRERQEEHGYRPMAGDYGRGSDRGSHLNERKQQDRDHWHNEDRRMSRERTESPWGQDEYRRSSDAGSAERSAPRDPGQGRNMDPHYGAWRDRHLSDLDRDYDEYSRERQSRFEDDFAGWREKRGLKRSLLAQVREQMEVVGCDGQRVGTIDKVAGDRLILTKADPESGGRHHSIGCTMIDRIDDNRIMLDCPADEARERWRDEDRSRALFERHDQGEEGPGVLNRSFHGTYRR